MILSKLFSKLSHNPPERAIYAQIVAKARQPWLYLEAGIPDTVTGRFDMITLHSFLVLEHLGGRGEKERRFGQLLFDEIFMDMDHSLREMGVGDLSVGKKVRKMSEVFYGACNAYREALAAPDTEIDQQLAAAFKRNVTGRDVPPEQLQNLVTYTRHTRQQIDNIPVKNILAGKAEWPDLDLMSSNAGGNNG